MVESNRKRTLCVAVTILVMSWGTVSFMEMLKYRCKSTSSCNKEQSVHNPFHELRHDVLHGDAQVSLQVHQLLHKKINSQSWP
jgi:hypothetical protein